MGVVVLPLPEIRTERLTLGSLHASDAQALYEYRSDPEVARYQTWQPGSVEDARVFIDGVQGVAVDTPGTWVQLAIRQQSNARLVGDLGVHFLPDDPRQVEVGFTVDPAFQGRGIGTEALTGLLNHLFGALHKHRVIASVDPRNVPSTALLRRVGMRQEAHFHESLWFKGEWADDLVFAILRSEWEHGVPSGGTV
jgi:RimJ/RimL family protein N-acetyltransferase